MGYMGGTICWHEPAKRYFIRIWWRGKDERFWHFNGIAFKKEIKPLAEKMLNKIRDEVDNGTFDPRNYRVEAPLSIAEYGKTWLRASDATDNCKKVYRWAVKKAVEHFGADFDIRNFTHSKLVMFQKSLTLSPDGKYNVLSALKTMLKFYQKDFPRFVLPSFPPLSKPEPETTAYLTFEEQQTVLAAIPERHRPIFIVMMEYGVRPQEATALKWDCVTADKIIFKRRHSEYRLQEQTKTGAIREERLTTRAKEAIEGLPRNAVWVFTHNGRSHYDSKVLNRVWHEATEKVGISIDLYSACRHSLGCQLVDAGYSIDFVQDTFKHTSIKTTRRYAKRQRAMIGEALENRGVVVELKKREVVSGE